jgi:uncharacterized protein
MPDELKLDATEARVLGVLIEKDLTTPDQYPLTLNSATLGCNQKSNRDPVLNLLESEVNNALGKLIVKGLAGSVHPMGSRVEKFRHNAEAVLKITTPQAAVLAELLMRGPQQPGELRARVSRMSAVETLPAMMELLKPLIDRGLVIRLDPAPGSRAESYAQTLAPTAHSLEARPAPAVKAYASAATSGALAATESSAPAFDAEPFERRIADLEFQVSKLSRQLNALAWKLGEKLEA